jgi:hypothetical protein
MKPPCGKCKNAYKLKSYYYETYRYKCRWNDQHNSKHWRCNKINDYFAFEGK